MSEAVARKLFDHLVGAGKEGGWDRQTDLLRSLQIDDQFEPSRLLDGQLGRFASFEDFRDIVGRYQHHLRKDTHTPMPRP
jgi:hypothetical protein